MSENKFYDTHCHLMNLSHPYLGAFLQKSPLSIYLSLNSIPGLSLLFSNILRNRMKNVNNLLAVMENDIGSMLILIEDCIKKDPTLYRDGMLWIGNNAYTKIVLTPLIMDFGYNHIERSESFYHKEASHKPVVEQVIDMFNGIKIYQEKSELKLFDVYPFMGLNTQNYLLESDSQNYPLKSDSKNRNSLTKMLIKYFKDYTGLESDFHKNLDEFDGEIHNISSNFFAGIKVYPPLGFDPWPEDKQEEMDKVKVLYDYCSKKGIPITTHCGDGGFSVINKKLALEYTDPIKWAEVLKEFPDLKLNIAHFGKQKNTFFIIPVDDWQKTILSLILKYDNVFADFSYRGVESSYYNSLIKLINGFQGKERDKLEQRILFGSDFIVNLFDIDSYNDYLRIYSHCPLNDEEKNLFCQANPQHFLFKKQQIPKKRYEYVAREE